MSYPEPNQSLTGPELEQLLKDRPDRLPPTGIPNGAKVYQTTGAMFGIPGRDHASCLLYLQTVEANHRGDVRAHNGGKHMRWKGSNWPVKWDGKYGSRLWDGSVLSNHDDFDCLEDLEALGLLVDYGTGFQPMIRLTKKGHEACSLMISERSAWEKKPEREIK